QTREPDVIGGDHRSAERVLVDIADFEVLEHASGPTSFDGHHTTPCARNRAIASTSNPSSPSAGTAPISRSSPSTAVGGSSASIGPAGESTLRHRPRLASCG